MKRYSVFSLLLVLFSTSLMLTSCKKGEEDPALSLRSRYARVVGDWKLHSGSTAFSAPFQADRKETYTDAQVVYDSAGVKKYHAFTWDFSFENDGTFTSVKKETAPGGLEQVETVKGRWQFTMKNKQDDLKNREGIMLTITHFALSSGGALSTSETINPVFGEIWMLERLSHHEFTILMSESESVPPGIRKMEAKFNFRSLKKSVVV